MIESRTCLLPMVTPQSTFLVDLHRHYKNAVLPYAGGILDQPAYYAEAMGILSSREDQILAERVERDRRRRASEAAVTVPFARGG